MVKKVATFIIFLGVTAFAQADVWVDDVTVTTNPGIEPHEQCEDILVDSSRGDIWWFPQVPTGTEDPTAPHQGKKLADYLRSQGFAVDELPRFVTIDSELLSQYDIVLATHACYPYAAEEIDAYLEFVQDGGDLFVIADHFCQGGSCAGTSVARAFDLTFTGCLYGEVTTFEEHRITEGVSVVPYFAGSYVLSPPLGVTVLGYINETLPVLGVIEDEPGKIVFFGELNSLEQVPQPLTDNIYNFFCAGPGCPPIAGGITFPYPDECFGPDDLPVVVTDDFFSTCELTRSYDPPGGPEYTEHGDYWVTVTATDSEGGFAEDSVAFAIDTVAPVVELLRPSGNVLIPNDLPFSVLFTATDDDGATGEVVRERVYLKNQGFECEIYDGLGYGTTPDDGLLSNETLYFDHEELCRISELCGFSQLTQPEIIVRAWDCGGSVGTDSVQMQGTAMLLPGVCGD